MENINGPEADNSLKLTPPSTGARQERQSQERQLQKRSKEPSASTESERKAIEEVRSVKAKHSSRTSPSSKEAESSESEYDADERQQPAPKNKKAQLPPLSPPDFDITDANLEARGFYDMPSGEAAHKLGRTEGSFQRLCRKLQIKKWPYRNRKSLRTLIKKTNEYVDDDVTVDGITKEDVMKGLRDYLEHIRVSKETLSKEAKSFRQHIFKIDHKMSKKNIEDPEAKRLETSYQSKQSILLSAMRLINGRNEEQEKANEEMSKKNARRAAEAANIVNSPQPTASHVDLQFPNPFIPISTQMGQNYYAHMPPIGNYPNLGFYPPQACDIANYNQKLAYNIASSNMPEETSPTRPTPRHVSQIPVNMGLNNGIGSGLSNGLSNPMLYHPYAHPLWLLQPEGVPMNARSHAPPLGELNPAQQQAMGGLPFTQPQLQPAQLQQAFYMLQQSLNNNQA